MFISGNKTLHLSLHMGTGSKQTTDTFFLFTGILSETQNSSFFFFTKFLFFITFFYTKLFFFHKLNFKIDKKAYIFTCHEQIV